MSHYDRNGVRQTSLDDRERAILGLPSLQDTGRWRWQTCSEVMDQLDWEDAEPQILAADLRERINPSRT